MHGLANVEKDVDFSSVHSVPHVAFPV